MLITSEYPPGPGGIGNHGYNLSKHLNICGFDVTVLTISDYTDKKSAVEFDKRQNFKIIRFPRNKSRVGTFAGRIKLIKSVLDKDEFKLIIFSGRFSLYSSLFLKKYRKKTKFTAIVHGTDINAGNLPEKYLIKKVLLNMDLIIPVSRFSSEKISSAVSIDKVTVIPNGFDIDGIDNFNYRNGKLAKDRLNLITVGSVSPRKGQHNVLNSLPYILKEYPFARYIIAGRVSDDSRIKNYLNSGELKDKVELTGQIDNNRLIELLRNSDIFIMLSGQERGSIEGFGIAILEANSFGLPAIGSKESGIRDAVSEGVSGLLVNPENPEEVLNAVKKITENYESYSRGAAEWASKHHWSEIIKKYLEAFNSFNIE